MPNVDAYGSVTDSPTRGKWDPGCSCLHCTIIFKYAKRDPKLIDLFFDADGNCKEELIDKLASPYGYAIFEMMKAKGLDNGGNEDKAKPEGL